MTPARPSEVDARLARLESPRGNGGAAPSADDLDWILFHSFPGSEVPPDRLAELLPHYIDALGEGAKFDVELLYVRVLELGGAVSEALRVELARAGARRTLAQRFDAADAIATVRFAIRVMPKGDRAFLDAIAGDSACGRLRFELSLDYLLDERDLSDYLALSYLRDGDPDAEPVLARFPIPAEFTAVLATFFDDAACRRRVRDGWIEWVDAAERAMLAEALRTVGLDVPVR